MTLRRLAIPATLVPAALALGYRVVCEAAMGVRGEGPHVLVEWSGEGSAPELHLESDSSFAARDFRRSSRHASNSPKR